MTDPQPAILLVEDNDNDIELMNRALQKTESRLTLDVALDGEQALAYLFETLASKPEKLAHHPVVVILDLHLPETDGLEVLARLRQDQRTRSIPVVVLTSSNEKEDKAKAYQLGANSFIRKPLDFQQFVEMAKNLATYWTKLNLQPRRRMPLME